MKELAIIMPVYNEYDNVRALTCEWLWALKDASANADIILFNDGSTDKTGELLTELSSNNSSIVVINKNNSGHGDTVIQACKYAVENRYEYIFMTDSDRQTDPKDFKIFWENRFAHDAILGYRLSRGDGLFRSLLSRCLRVLLFAIFHADIKDSNVPFRLYKNASLKELNSAIPQNHPLANIFYSVSAVMLNYNVLWLPINFTSRSAGSSFFNIKKIAMLGSRTFWDLIAYKKNIQKKGS